MAARLKDEDADIRRVAVRGLGRLKDPRCVPVLIPCLDDNDVTAAQAAAEVLGDLRDPQEVEPLMTKLDSPELGTVVIRALGRIGDPRVVEPLLSRLPQAPAVVQVAILEALADLGQSGAADGIFQVLENPDTPEYIRQTAARSLGKLADRRALAPLLKYALDAEPPLQQTLVEALRALSEEAIPRLREQLASSDASVRKKAAQLLIQIGFEPERMDERVDLLLVAEDWARLEALGEAGIGPLTARLRDRSPSLRPQIAQLLTRMGFRPATPRAIVDMVMAGGDPVRQEEQISQLGLSAVEPLLTWLRMPDAPTRARAAELLAKVGYSPRTQTEAAWWALAKGDWSTLEKLGPAAAEAVAVLLTEEADAAVRAAAFLAKLGDFRAAPFVARRMPQWKERQKIFYILKRAEWQPRTEAEAVYYHVAGGHWDWLREHWEQTRKVLVADLRSNEFRRVEHAVYALISIGREEVIPDLIEAFERHGTIEMGETFLNSGNARLRRAAEEWCQERGYTIGVGPGAQEAFWPRDASQPQAQPEAQSDMPRPTPETPAESEPSPPPDEETPPDAGPAPPAPPNRPSRPMEPGEPAPGPSAPQPADVTSSERLERMRERTEAALERQRIRQLIQAPLDDPARQRPVVDPMPQGPPLEAARPSPLLESWRHTPSGPQGMLPSAPIPPAARAPVDPGRLAPLPRMSVPSFGPSFGRGF
ncbi:MAG: HEAT repeat domain-containing protein [Thermoguttaceae bacterium]|nr:HEAT repeat domain-containing protein [Thermoguttaceae bacterium]